MSTLRLILGDQLSQSVSSLEGCDQSKDIILMCEVWNEVTYVKHHKKKLLFCFHPCATLQKSWNKQDTKLNIQN